MLANFKKHIYGFAALLPLWIIASLGDLIISDRKNKIYQAFTALIAKRYRKYKVGEYNIIQPNKGTATHAISEETLANLIISLGIYFSLLNGNTIKTYLGKR